MGRGVSAGGGQSSLGYLFGSGEAPAPAPASPPPPTKDTTDPSSGASMAPAQAANSKPSPPAAGGYTTNNYFRTDGPNCGNFITDRPSTKVHAAPGGGSSLDYLFGNGNK